MAQRILVFESDSGFANEIRSGFQRLGAQVDVVADGNAGIERAERNVPDLILLSIELPSMNGFLVCKKIKKHTQLKDIPLIIMSNDANAEEIFDQHRKLRTHAEDYIRKPVKFGELLKRVNQVVPISGSGNQEVVEDLDLEEDIQLEEESPSEIRVRAVDEEIDAFAESAFDALVVGSEKKAASPTKSDRVASVRRSGGPGPMEDSGTVRLEDLEATVVTPGDMLEGAEPSVPPPAGNAQQGGAATEEIMSLRGRLAEVERELGDARARAADADRLDREIAELKSKSSKSGGISSREFLDLREALNRKDKEILDLRDQLSGRDKQVLEMREKNLELERGKADFEDRLISLERKLADSTDRADGLAADKETITRRADDLKKRLEAADALGKKLEQSLQDEKQGRAREVESLRRDYAAETTSMREQHEEESARAAASNAHQMEELRAAHTSALEAIATARREETEGLRAAHASEIEDLRQEHTSAVQRMQAEAERVRNEHAQTVQRLQEERDATVRGLNEAHAAALATQTAEGDALRRTMLEELRNELEGEMAQRLSEAEARREAELEAARQEHATTLAARERQLEEAHAEARRKAEEKHSKELALLGRRLTESETTLQNTRTTLQQTEATRAQLEADLGARTEERDMLSAELSAARANITELETVRQDQAGRIEQLEARERELDALRQDHTARISYLETRENDLETLRRDHTSRIEQLEGRERDLETLRRDHTARIEHLEARERDLDARLIRALKKISDDEELLERVRRAVTIGLGLLEDQKRNVLGDAQS